MSKNENEDFDLLGEKSEKVITQNAPKVFQFIDGNTLMRRKYEPLNICNVSYGDVSKRYFRTEFFLSLVRAKSVKVCGVSTSA